MTLAPTTLTKSLVNLALQAGREIMAIYATDFGARTKSDLTPVTEADEAAERVILEGLAKLDPRPRSFPKRPPPPGAFRKWETASILWTPWTAPRSSSPAMANSPSISPASKTAFQWWASSMLRPSGACSGATPQRALPKAKLPRMRPLAGKNCWSAPARRWRHRGRQPQPQG